MAQPTVPLLGNRSAVRHRRFILLALGATLLCGVVTISLSLERAHVELLGNGANIYATLERPVHHFLRDLPQSSQGDKFDHEDPHEDRVLRKMRRLRAEQAKLEDDKQSIIDRLTRERDAAQLEVARTAVDAHRVRLSGMGDDAAASSVGRAKKMERQGYEFARRAYENDQKHHAKWLEYWNHVKDVREKRLKELDDMLRTGPGALRTKISGEDLVKKQTEHCTTVRKMLNDLESEAESVEDEDERAPLLEHIEAIKAVVSKCGTAGVGGRVKPDRAQASLTKEDFLKYAANLARHAPVGPDGKRLTATSYDDWMNAKKKPWWAGHFNIRKLGGTRVGRTKADTKQPWWKGRWNVRGQGIRKKSA